MLNGLIVKRGKTQRGRSDAELEAQRQAMRACCERIEVVYELEVTDDWLQRDTEDG